MLLKNVAWGRWINQATAAKTSIGQIYNKIVWIRNGYKSKSVSQDSQI